MKVLTLRSSVAKMLIEGGQEQTWILGNKIITVTTSGCGQRPMRNGLCDKCIQLCRKENGEHSLRYRFLRLFTLY